MIQIHGDKSLKRSLEIPSQWVLLICSAALLTAGFVIRADVPREFRILPYSFIILSSILLWFGIHAVIKGHPQRWLGSILTKTAAWLGSSPGQALCLPFSLCFSLLTTVAAGFERHMYSPAAAVLCWLAAILLAVYSGYAGLLQPKHISRSALLIGFILFTGALLLRAINTATIPAVLTGDEGSSGLYAVEFLKGEIDNIFIGGWFSFPTLHNFIQSISILVFGQTTQALRLLAAFAGAVTVVLVFFVGRSMFGMIGGVTAGIILAGMHFHIHFSRIGLNNIWDGIFATLTLGFLWIGWQKNSRSAFIVAGLGLGLAQYFYTTGRSLLLIIPVWLIAAGLCDRKRIRNVIPGLVLVFWIALIIALPLGWFYANHYNEFMAPINRVAITENWLDAVALETGKAPLLIILDQLWQAAQGFVSLNLIHWYRPGVPVLRSMPAHVFMLGLILFLIRPKDSRGQLIFLWLAAITSAVGLSESVPAAQRYVAAAPATALAIGFCLQQMCGFLKKIWPSRASRIPAALVLFALMMSINDARFYFLGYTPNSYFGGFNGRVAQVLAERLQSEPEDQEVVFCGYPHMGYHSISSLPYLAPQIKYYDVNEPWGSVNDPQPAGERILFAFLPEHEADQAAIVLSYPGGSWSEYSSDAGEFLFRIYEYEHP